MTPIAEQMQKAAEAFATFEHPTATALDYSPASLKAVDELLLEARDGMGKQQLELYASCAGAYLGEVVRRRSPVKLEWVTSPAGPALMSPKGLQLNVLGKPFKLIENGATDSLAWFAQVAQDQLSRELTNL